ncbi:hypothetical protein BWQ96_07945 [Gracilariopsis chorda]|uniref:Uncharacterized protein n=1 Tax=Gracilariopsis chorda TaxID=448386 RepID=A0A2V3IMH2_9FLOR|nr:hypothetical protein BWQ96_07945 [Gracilariopsis chorda]|eukprot:PXF42310.1 hypothetical protein BWQ96_07945 [Gracilariopsis chorda]
MHTANVVERYRKFFRSLSHDSLHLSAAELLAAREAANTPQSWRQLIFSLDSANLRRQLSLALLANITASEADDVRYEPDQGMLDGDDGGYASLHSLLKEDKIRSSFPPPYALLGSTHEAPLPTHGSIPSPVPALSNIIRDVIDHTEQVRLEMSERSESRVIPALSAELSSMLSKAQQGHLRDPAQCAQSLQQLLEKHSLPEPLRQRFEGSISIARENARLRDQRRSISTQTTSLLTGLLAADASPSALQPLITLRPPRKRPRSPSFTGPSPRSEPPVSLVEFLGSAHPMVKNVNNLRHFRLWRAAIISKVTEMRAKSNLKKEAVISQPSPRVKSPRLRTKKARRDTIELFNDVERAGVSPKQDRIRATSLSACALLLAHVEFTHASTNALNLLCDVVEEFVTRIGASLTACRENVDNNEGTAAHRLGRRRTKTSDEREEELRIICESGFRGGFTELLYYARKEALRVAVKLHEMQKRFEHSLVSDEDGAALRSDPEQIKLIDAAVRAELSNQSRSTGGKIMPRQQDVPITEEDLKLDDEPFIFGYLNEAVRLDVLGNIKVPARILYGKKTTGKDSTASGRVEKVQRSPRPKGKIVPMSFTPSSSTPLASITPVKPEVSLMKVSEQ